MWFESGQRWKFLARYGWRLAVLSSFVVLNIVLSYRIYVANPFDLGTALLLFMFATLVSASFAPIPWVYVAHELRWQHQIRSTAFRLSGFVESVTADTDLGRTWIVATTKTNEPWTAWHPTLERCEPTIGGEHWFQCYISTRTPVLTLIPIEPETFLAWNIPTDSIGINKDLPVCGAHGSSFSSKIREGNSWVSKLVARPNQYAYRD